MKMHHTRYRLGLIYAYTVAAILDSDDTVAVINDDGVKSHVNCIDTFVRHKPAHSYCHYEQ